MIEIIGTSHISPESIEKVKKRLEEDDFDVVAVELDRKRLLGMEQEQKSVNTRNPMAMAISKVQKYLSKKTGITPGSEMLTAVHEAEKRDISVSLIDRDITDTIRKFKQISVVEKIKMFAYLVTGFIGSKKLDFELDQIPEPEIIEDLLKRFEIVFPDTYNVLIHERNLLMAEKLSYLERRFGNVLAVIGAGHEPGIRNLLSGN